MKASPPPLARYLERTLGTGTPRETFQRMLFRAFTAKSLGEFWLYWNPIYGYFLRFYCYRALRHHLPQGISAWLTFVFSGFFLHDLLFWPASLLSTGAAPFPFVALAFALIGLAVEIGKLPAFSLASLRPAVRALVHISVICGGITAAIALRATMAPNPSVEARPNGKPTRPPGAVVYPTPVGRVALPSAPPHLER